jgi:PHD/YefM family antitoxin component YafN of YafNO toxin-antitoxin module
MFSADLGPEESMPQSRVRFVGSRELHRDLPKVLEALENPGARFVLTIHSKPKAVLIGAEAFLEIMRNPSTEDRLLALQLGALVQGLESSNSTSDTSEIDQRQRALVAV